MNREVSVGDMLIAVFALSVILGIALGWRDEWRTSRYNRRKGKEAKGGTNAGAVAKTERDGRARGRADYSPRG